MNKFVVTVLWTKGTRPSRRPVILVTLVSLGRNRTSPTVSLIPSVCGFAHNVKSRDSWCPENLLRGSTLILDSGLLVPCKHYVPPSLYHPFFHLNHEVCLSCLLFRHPPVS